MDWREKFNPFSMLNLFTKKPDISLKEFYDAIAPFFNEDEKEYYVQSINIQFDDIKENPFDEKGNIIKWERFVERDTRRSFYHSSIGLFIGTHRKSGQTCRPARRIDRI